MVWLKSQETNLFHRYCDTDSTRRDMTCSVCLDVRALTFVLLQHQRNVLRLRGKKYVKFTQKAVERTVTVNTI